MRARRWAIAHRGYTLHAGVLVLGLALIAMTIGGGAVAVRQSTASMVPESDASFLRSTVVLESAPIVSRTPESGEGEPSLAPEATPDAGYVQHVVEAGETLGGIAADYGVDTEYLIWNNPEVGPDPDSLIIGESLLVPTSNSIVYDVRLGDTITDIAATYGVDPSAVVSYEANRLESPDLITEGMVLVIPGAVPPPPPEPEPVIEEPADVGGGIVLEEPVSAPVPAAVDEPVAALVDTTFYGYIWPGSGTIWSYFGPRWGSVHKGLDIGMAYGEGVMAAAAGQVVLSTYSDNGYGNYVIVQHGDGSKTLYAHMSERYVSLGQYVNQGDILGAVGCTGWCTGPHVHFEIQIGGSPVDPLLYLP